MASLQLLGSSRKSLTVWEPAAAFARSTFIDLTNKTHVAQSIPGMWSLFRVISRLWRNITRNTLVKFKKLTPNDSLT